MSTSITSSSVTTSSAYGSDLKVGSYTFNATSNSNTSYSTSSSYYYLATRYWLSQNIKGPTKITFETYPSSKNDWVVCGAVSIASGTYQGVKYCDDSWGNAWWGSFTGSSGSVGLGGEGGFWIGQRTN